MNEQDRRCLCRLIVRHGLQAVLEELTDIGMDEAESEICRWAAEEVAELDARFTILPFAKVN